MTPRRKQRIFDVLERRQGNLTVIADTIAKDRNLAAIIRTCDAVGIATVHCVAAENSFRSYAGTSASANKYVETKLYDNALQPVGALQQQGYQVLSAHLSGDAKDYREMDYTKPTAIVMGAELTGVSDAVSSLCDHNIVIPMMGMVESYNVSVACAIILAEAQTQRQASGMYELSSIEEKDKMRLFFKWAYPKLAEYCDDRGLSYPPIDKNGDLIAGTAPTSQRD